MTEDQPAQHQRWHDNRGDLSKAVDLLESLPQEVRPLIADALTGKANKDFQAGEILSSLKSLGKETIMALHQARKKRRAYDQDQNLHQIVNTFMVLPEDAQEHLATDFLVFSGLMVEYMANCDTFELEPNTEELSQMRDRFVESGASAVEEYLSQIHKPYYDLLLAESESNPLPGDSVVQEEEGLRIKGSQLD